MPSQEDRTGERSVAYRDVHSKHVWRVRRLLSHGDQRFRRHERSGRDTVSRSTRIGPRTTLQVRQMCIASTITTKRELRSLRAWAWLRVGVALIFGFPFSGITTNWRQWKESYRFRIVKYGRVFRVVKIRVSICLRLVARCASSSRGMTPSRRSRSSVEEQKSVWR